MKKKLESLCESGLKLIKLAEKDNETRNLRPAMLQAEIGLLKLKIAIVKNDIGLLK